MSSTDVWITAAPQPGYDHYRLTVASPPIRVVCGDSTLFFDASQRFSTYHDGEQFRVRSKGYVYTVATTETMETETVGWHWHPPAHSRPHAHIGGTQLGHVPTGRVSFEAVARYLIEELGATPGRSDWSDVLTATEALHVKYRSWSAAPHIDPDGT